MGIQIRRVVIPLVFASLFRSVWASASTIYDDRDPSIQYTGQWHAGGTPYEYSGTTYVTTALGSTATFTFTGTQVRVYGTRAHSGNYTTLSTYSIDGGTPGEYTDTSVNDGPARYQVLFYTSNTLSNSNHVLTIVNQGDWYILDYILVDVPDATTPAAPTTDRVTTRISTSIITVNSQSTNAIPQETPSTSPLVSSSSTPNAEEPTVVYPTSSPLESSILSTAKVESGSNSRPAQSLSSSSSSTTSAVSDPTLLASSTSQKTRLGTPAIAGIVVASFLGLIILLVALYMYRRRRRSHVEVDGVSGVTPFQLGNDQHSGNVSTGITGAHPSFQTNEKGIGTVSSGPSSGNLPTDGQRYGREPPQSLVEHEGQIHPALWRATGLADESMRSLFETQPPTYTQF